MNQYPLICSSCIYFETEQCIHPEVLDLTYVECSGHPLSKEEKQESWIHCEKYYDQYDTRE